MLNEIDKYVTGSTCVTKHTVTCHLSSTAHKIAQDIEKLVPGTGPAQSDDDVILVGSHPATSTTSQPRIDDSLHAADKDVYHKLLQTAYLLAIDGLPLSSFKSLVKVQKSNGVQLICKNDNGEKPKNLYTKLPMP